MIRHSPCEYYLKYLVVHPAGYTNLAIRDLLDSYQLDWIGNTYVDKIRNFCRPPPRFDPTDKMNVESQKFLLQEGIHELFHPNAGTKTAFQILETPKAKLQAEVIHILNTPLIYAVKTMYLFGLPACTVEGLSQYKKFFYNVDLVDKTELFALLHMRLEACARSGDADVRMQKDYMKKAFYSDPRVIAARCPRTAASSALVMMRMGIEIEELTTDIILEKAQHMAAMRTWETTYSDAVNSDRVTLNYAQVAKIVSEIRKELIDSEDVLRKSIAQIGVKTSDHKVPNIKEITGGRHTVDMAAPPPLLEEADADKQK